MERKSSPDVALASDVFDQFCAASTLKSVLTLHHHLCELLRLRPSPIPHFYPLLKAKLRSWRAQALWTKFDKRFAHKCYARGLASEGTKVLIIGAGPCGLRAAIEAQLLGAKVVVVEKRDRISRNNVLHLWPFVINDLRALGAKKFFGKFCAGAIDHISIRQLQVMLLKAALLLGVEIHVGVSFERLIPPGDGDFGWRAETGPADHPVSQFEFDCLIGADGKRNTLEGFGRKEFRGKLAIAITANFLNKRSEAEARVEEISGVAFIFNQKFFRELYEATGIDLENIVYYKDDTHYFVMTAKKHSLLDKGVIISDQADTARLLHPDNVDKEALMEYAREAADFSTKYQLPHLEFAVNHYGQPDVAMFDFTSMYAAENASKVIEKNGHRLLMQLVGDSLLEPFWPTGSGCARGFLSSLDACWAVRSWASGVAPLEVISERESIYRLLGQTTPENLSKDLNGYTLEPNTRYPNLNLRAVLPPQVRNLVSTDNPATLEVAAQVAAPPKKRRRDLQVPLEVLLVWLQRQTSECEGVVVCEDLAGSFKDGMALCAIVHRYRPLLLDLPALRPQETLQNLQLAFNVLEKEAQIKPIIKAEEWASGENSDAMLTYLSLVYYVFRGEIPHLKQSKTIEEIEEILAPRKSLGKSPKKRASLEREPKRQVRKRRSHDSEEYEGRRQEIERNREERMQRRRMMRHLSTQTFIQNMRRMQTAGNFYDETKEEKSEDFSLKVYRQHAPHFKDRVKEMEQKILYPDRENRLMAEAIKRSAQPDEKFSGRIKELEAKFKGNPIADKKPKDLRRAIGRIDKGDWHLAQIERKMEENRMGKGKAHGGEKVPKWSHDKFVDKISLMQSKLKGRSKEDEAKFREIDSTLKRLDRKIREGSVLDPSGPRGANKVSAMAEQLAKKNEPLTEGPPIQKSSSKGTFVMNQQASDCHFCSKRVYLMERLTAEGVFFHRGCFRCEYCGTTLRQNNYAFDRDGRHGSRFVCTQHFGLPGYVRGARARRKSEDHKVATTDEAALSTPRVQDQADNGISVGVTPERVEFENLAGAGGSDDEFSEARPASGMAEMDEEAWTDHNFGASCADDSSEENSESLTDSDEEEDAEAFEEAIEADPLSVEGTRQLAESWKRRYSHQSASEVSDEDDSSEWSYGRDDAEDEDGSSTATEGDALARELLLRQNERLLERAKRRREEDSEGGSDCTSTETESDDEEDHEEENLATEIETDSEFELDSSLPTILIDSELQVCHVKKIERGNLNKPTANKYLQKNNNKNNNKPTGAPLPTEMTQAALKHRPQNLDLKPQREKVPLQPVKSTEGIASKTSLELKKRYLLGGDSSAFGKQVQKSDSASALDSRFRSFVSQISEQQKLLQPAAQPSQAMQSLLDNRLSPKACPLLTSFSTSNILNNRAEVLTKLPRAPSSFVHICGRKTEPKYEEDDKTPLVECKDLPDNDRESDKISDLEKEKVEDELTPRVEQRDIVLETKDISQESSEDVRPRSPAHETSIIVPDVSSWRKQDAESSESESESESESSASSTESEDSAGHVEATPAVVPPRVEITEAADKDAETELSDWAQEENENSLEMDVHVEARNVTVRRPKRVVALAEADDDLSDLDRVDILTVTETKEADPVIPVPETPLPEEELVPETPTPVPEEITEDIAPDTESKCDLVDVMSLSVSSIGEGIEDINFVDSSEDDEDSQKLEVEEDSKYEQLVHASSSTNTESKSSEISKTPDVLSTPDTEFEKLLQEEAYEAHVQRLQDRVSPFGNAKDSIDIRKARRNSSSSSPSKESSPSKASPATPSTSRKLLELNKERSRQKSLIEDLVMAKIPQKASGLRRRLSSKSPSGSPRMPLMTPPPVPPPPVEMEPPPVPPPPTPRPHSVVVTLPETPLTHPEAFSCPDIRKALFAEESPVAPPRTKKKSPKEPLSEPLKRERRKSLIQAVSDLFSRKKEKDDKGSPSSAPPLPPPPANYPDDSGSDGEDSKTFSIEGSLRRSARSAKKAARQAQLKRLRTAHELKRQLEECEEKQRRLEQRGVKLEKALKGEGGNAATNEAELLQEWFALMRQLSEARRYERELSVKAQELELQERHAHLQADLRQRMALDVEQKSSQDVEEEGKILSEILEIVEQRNQLSNQLDEDRQRYADEEQHLEAQMVAKGLRLTPIRKESNV